MLKLILIISDEHIQDFHFTFQFNCGSVIFRESVILTKATKHEIMHELGSSIIWLSLKCESLYQGI